MGVEIFPGFPASEVLYNDDGSVKGVATQDMGVARDGSHKGDYQPGMELHAKYTLFAEGARGHLTKQLKLRYDLEKDAEPQVYGIGIKELWDIPAEQHAEGRVIHTQGWPIADEDGFGGGFLYHQAGGQVALGYVTWLGYRNPHISPFEELQRWKSHPAIAAILKGGKRVSYGARAICDGGWQSLPKLTFPGGALIGCAAGFLNVPRIKGSHTAMKSGMMAAEAIADAISRQRGNDELTGYTEAYQASWVEKELRMVRNFEPIVSKFGGDHWHADRGRGDVARVSRDSPAVHDEASPRCRKDRPRRSVSADQVSQARWRAELRPAVLGGAVIHQSRGRSAVPLAADRSLDTCARSIWRGLPGLRRAIARRGSTNSSGWRKARRGSRSTPRTASTARPATSRTRLQNITWVTPEGGGGPNYPNM